jgi:hypothetical protein
MDLESGQLLDSPQPSGLKKRLEIARAFIVEYRDKLHARWAEISAAASATA